MILSCGNYFHKHRLCVINTFTVKCELIDYGMIGAHCSGKWFLHSMLGPKMKCGLKLRGLSLCSDAQPSAPWQRWFLPWRYGRSVDFHRNRMLTGCLRYLCRLLPPAPPIGGLWSVLPRVHCDLDLGTGVHTWKKVSANKIVIVILLCKWDKSRIVDLFALTFFT